MGGESSSARVTDPGVSAVVRRLPGLTRREAEILDLVAEGYSNGRVAKLLWVTDQTVKFHLSNIYRKLGVTNRTEATHWALTEGLGSDDRDQPAATGRAR